MRDSTGVQHGQMTWTRTPLGQGGWVAGGLSFSNAGDQLCGGDSNGCWVRANGGSKFLDLLNTSTMPSGSYGPGITNNVPDDGQPYGCAVQAIAPSNGNVGYFVINANLYKSSNLLSASPTATLLGGPYTPMEANTVSRHLYGRAVVDPQNPNVFLIGNMGSSLLYSTDGTTVQTLTVETSPTTYSGVFGSQSTAIYHLVAVDPSSAVVGGIKQVWYYSTSGTGIKRSTTGPGGPYTLVTGSPTSPIALKVDAAGNVWALNDNESTNGNIYKATSSGSFSKVTGPDSTTYAAIAINPQNTNQVVVCDPYWVYYQSTNGGTSWLGKWTTSNDVVAPTTSGWMQKRVNGKSTLGPNLPGYITSGDIVFHPTNGTLWSASGQGLFWSNPPASTASNWVWCEDGLGIEQLETTDVVTPPGGKPIFCVGDFGLMKIGDDTRGAKTVSWIPDGQGDETAWTVDYVPGNPNFLVSCCGYWHVSHAWSNDYGETWNMFPTTFPVSGLAPGMLVAPTTTDFYFFLMANLRPVSMHSINGTWAYEDVNMPGMNTKAFGYIGSGTSQLLVKSVADWDATGAQQFAVTFNAASGSGSVVDNAGAKTVTVTPAAGATAAQTATLINGNSTLVTAAATSTGAGVAPTGTVQSSTGNHAYLFFESGWGYFPVSWVTGSHLACTDKTNGDIYAYNYGDSVLGASAQWAGIWKRSQSGGTWSKVAAVPGGVGSTPAQLRHVDGNTGHVMWVSGGSFYRTTNGGTTWTQIANTSHVGWCSAGKAAPGQTYPTIWFYGALSGVYGLYRCDDGSWSNWINLGYYPGNSVYGVSQFCAHPDIYGRVDTGNRGGWTGTYASAFTVT